jgi:hypothetical protein
MTFMLNVMKPVQWFKIAAETNTGLLKVWSSQFTLEAVRPHQMLHAQNVCANHITLKKVIKSTTKLFHK